MPIKLILGLPAVPAAAAKALSIAADHYDGVDLAPYFCQGEALTLLKAVRGVDRLHITTRVPCVDRNAATDEQAYPPGWIHTSLTHQLLAAGIDHFALVLLENWRSSWSTDRVADELMQVRSRSQATDVGIALLDFDPAAAIEFTRVSDRLTLQGDASLVNRAFLETWSPQYLAAGARIQARAPFFHGLLCADSEWDAVDRAESPRARLFRALDPPAAAIRRHFELLASQAGVGLSTLALAYVASRLPDNAGVVIGCSTEDQAASNSRTWRLALEAVSNGLIP